MRVRQAVAWLLTLAVLVLAAASIMARPRPGRPNPTLTPMSQPPSSVSSVPPVGAASGSSAHLPFWLVLVLVAVALLGLAWLVSRFGWHAGKRARFGRRRVAAAVETEIDYAEVAEALARDAAARRRLLHGDDPRAGVLQAWLDVQAAAARSGLEREDAETSTEFTARVLSRWSVDPRALSELAAAYREAQFSDHPIGEDVRARVLAALDVIERSLAAAAQPVEAAP